MDRPAATDFVLDPCPFCGSPAVRIASIGSLTQPVVAAQCRACGARGPARPVMDDCDRNAVRALAADGWNAAERIENFALPPAERPHIPGPRADLSEPSGGGNGSESVPNTPPQEPSATEPTASPSLAEKPSGSTIPQAPPKGGGGEEVPDVEEIRARLKAYFKRTRKSVWSGSFSVSDVTVYHIMIGKSQGAPATLKTLKKELDAYQFADEIPEGEVGPKLPPIEELPNKLAPITGVNPIPKLGAPPRCGTTP